MATDLRPEYDFTGARRGSVIKDGPVEFIIDGAVGYRLRSLPDGGTLGEFDSTLPAMACALKLVGDGRSPRTLALDWVLGDGRSGLMFGGLRLEQYARWALGPRRTLAPATT